MVRSSSRTPDNSVPYHLDNYCYSVYYRHCDNNCQDDKNKVRIDEHHHEKGRHRHGAFSGIGKETVLMRVPTHAAHPNQDMRDGFSERSYQA
jgi:hypothetical protein